MGSCFSSESTAYHADPCTAKVISDNGNLREYPTPITVSKVLQMETETETEMTSCSFLCDSDSLFFDDYIPTLDSSEQLQAGQIYFVLPKTRLQYRLTATDMAALAVKASTALSLSLRNKDRRNKKIRISPVPELKNSQRFGNDGFDAYYEYDGFKIWNDKPRIEVSKSGSVGKLQRNSSFRRNKLLAIRSFRMKLSIILE